MCVETKLLSVVSLMVQLSCTIKNNIISVIFKILGYLKIVDSLLWTNEKIIILAVPIPKHILGL